MKRYPSWSAILAMAACVVSAEINAEELRPAPVQLRYEPLHILQWVARRMNIVLRHDIPIPHILFESTTSLKRFQHAMATQWRFEPHTFTNAYAVATNEIFLIDHAGYYGRLNRTVDDSLAHEFVHYLQARYLNAKLEDGSLETDAVAIQEWFRSYHADAVAHHESDSLRYSYTLQH